jgi:hypothetical protein
MAAPMIRLTFSALNFFRLQSFEDMVFLSSPQGQLWRNEYSKPSAWPSAIMVLIPVHEDI